MEESLSLEKSKQNKFKETVKKLKHDVKGKGDKVKPKKDKKKLKADRGIVYLGHIPHGFYEDEMKAFFSQFGKVTRVKLCRSEKSGRSKGYGYVEFFHPDVAKIAAESMNNYLMCKKRLVASYIPPEKQKRIFMNKLVNSKYPPAAHSRNKEISKKNKPINSKTHVIQCRNEVKNLQRKLRKLRELGINHTVEPVNAPTDAMVSIKTSTSSGDSGKSEEKKKKGNRTSGVKSLKVEKQKKTNRITKKSVGAGKSKLSKKKQETS